MDWQTESKKLKAFYAALLALLALLPIGGLMIWLLGTPWEFIGALATQILGILGIHNTNQMLADRSSNYNSRPSGADVPPPNVRVP